MIASTARKLSSAYSSTNSPRAQTAAFSSAGESGGGASMRGDARGGKGAWRRLAADPGELGLDGLIEGGVQRLLHPYSAECVVASWHDDRLQSRVRPQPRDPAVALEPLVERLVAVKEHPRVLTPRLEVAQRAVEQVAVRAAHGESRAQLEGRAEQPADEEPDALAVQAAADRPAPEDRAEQPAGAGRPRLVRHAVVPEEGEQVHDQPRAEPRIACAQRVECPVGARAEAGGDEPGGDAAPLQLVQRQQDLVGQAVLVERAVVAIRRLVAVRVAQALEVDAKHGQPARGPQAPHLRPQ